MNLPQDFFRTEVSTKWNTTIAGNFYISTLPTPENGYLVINPLSASKREIVRYTGKGTDGGGNYITIAADADRGLGGTTAQTHEIGEPVRMNITSLHWQEVQDAVDAIVAAGAENASTTQKGFSKLSVAPASATEPIAVGTNDPRVPDADPDTLYIKPSALVATSAGAGDAGKGVKLNAAGQLDQTFTKSPIVRTYTSGATWIKSTGLKYVIAEVQGGGGGGAASYKTSDDEAGGGGGGGGYSKKLIAVASLGATETVTVGGGGAGGIESDTAALRNGSAGGTSSFGSHCSATGGAGGIEDGNGGLGGDGSNGDLNIGGSDGGPKVDPSGLDAAASGSGGDSHLGGGGGGKFGDATDARPGNLYGGGGGGACGTSRVAGGAGAAGIVIVTEFYN